MKKLTLVLTAVALLAFAATQATASTSQASSVKTVTVAMKDPGCHWFSVAGTFKTSLTVKGPVRLLNLDEAALKIVGPAGVKRDAVGAKIALGRGVYKITMVGQAPDDNHLKLVVT